MSDFDVYDDEMLKTKFSDADVERIIAGEDPENEALAPLHATLQALQGTPPLAPSEEGVQRLAAAAASLALSSRPEGAGIGPAAHSEDASRSRRLVLAVRQRLAVLAVAIFVFAGVTGVAFAADEAAPGDTLYGLDLALERVGINNGASEERIAEAQALAAEGRIPEAMRHVADVLDDAGEATEPVSELGTTRTDELSNSAAALREAADNVQNGNDDPEFQAVRDAVAAMLAEMAEMTGDPELHGAEFGQRVSEMARSIGGDDSQEGSSAESEEDSQESDGPGEDGGPPDGVPAGRPDGEGPSDDAGPPDGAGLPEDAGPPGQ